MLMTPEFPRSASLGLKHLGRLTVLHLYINIPVMGISSPIAPKMLNASSENSLGLEISCQTKSFDPSAQFTADDPLGKHFRSIINKPCLKG